MTEKGIELIKYFEGCKLEAYKCPAGEWTIGIGATYYPDGTHVKQGDKLKSVEEAEELLQKLLQKFENAVDRLVKSKINPYQRDALISLTYNIGEENLRTSTILRKVNNNPDDPTIKDEFVRWVYAKHIFLEGLLKRRKAEANLYFTEWKDPLPEYNSTDPRGPYYPSQDDDKDNVSWMYQYHSEHE